MHRASTGRPTQHRGPCTSGSVQALLLAGAAGLALVSCGSGSSTTTTTPVASATASSTGTAASATTHTSASTSTGSGTQLADFVVTTADMPNLRTLVRTGWSMIFNGRMASLAAGQGYSRVWRTSDGGEQVVVSVMVFDSQAAAIAALPAWEQQTDLSRSASAMHVPCIVEQQCLHLEGTNAKGDGEVNIAWQEGRVLVGVAVVIASGQVMDIADDANAIASKEVERIGVGGLAF
jgi:hypothetical protein